MTPKEQALAIKVLTVITECRTRTSKFPRSNVQCIEKGVVRLLKIS